MGKKNKLQDYKGTNRVRLVRGGKEYFDCLQQMIDGAKKTLHLQTYIFNDDETGQKIGDSLKAAAGRGVHVYLLVDGYASKILSRAFLAELRSAGINFRFFEPIFKSKNFYFGRRLHHKVVVADASIGLVGGVNISDRYNDVGDKKGWLDFAMYIEGEVVQELCVVCWKSWYSYRPGFEQSPCDQVLAPFKFPENELSEVGVRRNDWVRRKNQISSTYIHMFRTAKSHITILCSYFLPGRIIRHQLAYAAKKGIRIKIITAGISDVMLSKYAERYMYGWLLRNNIEIYEYQPNVLHGKIAVCDGEWMTIGSYNINDISAYASIELNVNVRSQTVSRKTEEILDGIIEKDCIRITAEHHSKDMNLLKRLAHWFSYEFIRVVFYLFTFYFKHRD
jgi:cardiolipin synthase A/B